MKLWRRAFAAMLSAALALMLFGCSQEAPQTTLPSTTPTQPHLTAAEQYAQARSAIDGAENLILKYTMSETREVGGSSYTHTITGNASLSQVGKASMMAIVEEALCYGTYESVYKEIYCDGGAYVQINENGFSAKLTAQEFVDRQLPAVLLESALYENVSSQIREDMTQITFSEPKALESWITGSRNAQLIHAEGAAMLDSGGGLVETSYQAEYIWGQTKYQCDVSVQVTAPKVLELGAKHPEHYRNCPELSDIRVPKLLLKAVGDIYAMEIMRCNAVESIYSEAIPVSYVQKSDYFLSGSEENMEAKAQYVITLSDYRGDILTTTQEDSFEDGVFTTSVNGGKPSEQAGVTAQQMHQYLEDAVLSAVMAPKYVLGAQVQDTEESYKLVLQGNEAFASDLMVGIMEFLEVDLDAKAEEMETTESEGYLTIDKESGLPVSMGLLFSRQHTMDSVSYRLAYRLDQEIELSENE